MIKEDKGTTTSEKLIIVAVIVAIAGAGIFYLVENYGWLSSKNAEETGYETFYSQKYGFYLTYPASWALDNMERMGTIMVMLRENSSPTNPRAQARITAGSLGYPPLDNLKRDLDNMLENNENYNLIGEEIEEITIKGVPGIDFSFINKGAQGGDTRGRMVILQKDNFNYSLQTLAAENSYEKYESDLNLIVENFSLIE
ncbi:hypothetical protein AKJ37_06890 [candidate division MSBL1 archaeon SCGC-AAA259I09]|uniref:PsbP C-terminal domain-containing protein n=6 Tax=candidate division MSBL1 TaxID=215777 RepID=A0A133URD5_9EURY|nr:hypothetical protein AKJ62_00690 [candidate division MSBL1 archaeon SCGC-AAA259D14]KXA92699.1 hypothetical protein AKJ66_03715 [candidate division MSBL1 archaeon SCGC-AAA259E22]KXA95193.1 hypothetical protein AKJ36_01335 [candidate division MSBL1 archaeon SCGC-AAA259I07]KXA95350.1 hypothetical protein AKJ37_06890 [candidate division MSBL1 archaeon SCGC-AAA259I09]KXA96700.1 hypothetical protein AKJ38_02820 [candidate division MSBL1 archaeon SCGC-AAA259I14]KXA97577.1 hypothetical protein AKJ3